MEDGSAVSDPTCAAVEAALTEGLARARKRQKVEHMALGLLTPRCGKQTVFADSETAKNATTPDSLWRVASVTKTYVAATVLNLAEAGKLGLDDPLAKFLPTYPNGESITLRQLLNHTSGVPDFFQTAACKAAMASHLDKADSPDAIIGYAATEPPMFAPGEGWGYSNTNYVLLGRVIEVAAAGTLAALLRDNALARAGLAHTFFAGAEPTAGAFVEAFEQRREVSFAQDPQWAGASGAMAATPSDLLDWAAQLYGSDAVLSAAGREQMLTAVSTDVASLRYGLGVIVYDAASTDGNGVAYGHFGSLPGYQTELQYLPEKQVAIAALVSDSAGLPHAATKVAYAALKLLE